MLNQCTRFATASMILWLVFPLTIPAFADTYTKLSNTRAASNIFTQASIEPAFRLRYEQVHAEAIKDASALTLRSRLLFQSGEYQHLQLSLEAENVSVLSSENFSDGVRNRTTALIPDPDSTEFNQAFLRFNGLPGTIIQVGRQRVSLGDERFIGSVNFRQNEQTFDAVSLLWKPTKGSHFYYAYLDQLNSFLGESHPAGRQSLNAHLLNSSFDLSDDVSLSVFHYAIDNHDLPSSSNISTGLKLDATHKFERLKLGTSLSYVRQHEGDNSPASYDADYSLVELRLGVSRYQFSVGQEQLGADTTGRFQTPLATLHKFQGLTDLFVVTPVKGVQDRYTVLGVNLGAGQIAFACHRFAPESGAGKFGEEYSVTARYRFNEQLNLQAQYAHFDDQGLGSQNLSKFWLQLEYKP